MEPLSEVTKRLQETIRGSSEESTLLLTTDNGTTPETVPVVSKICSIISQHFAEPPFTSVRSFSENCIYSRSSTDIHRTNFKANNSYIFSNRPATAPAFIASFNPTKMSAEEVPPVGSLDDGQETSLGQMEQDMYFKQFLAEHENQLALWEQMGSFRREYTEMRSHVESILTRLHMEFTSMAREASCNFVLLLSQMGCPSCSSGEGLEVCFERVKQLKGDLERAQIENSALINKVESLTQLKSQLQDRLDDRENAIQSLSETIDQLQSHCHQLEENSSDLVQWQELMDSLEKALRSIGQLVVDDSGICNGSIELKMESELGSPNMMNLPLLAESTVAAVRAALLRRKNEIEQLQAAVEDRGLQIVQSNQSRDDNENKERAIQKEIADLRIQLSNLLEEKQVWMENAQQSEQEMKETMLKLGDKERNIQQLKGELEREKASRLDIEQTLNEFRKEEALQRNSHCELLAEFQQLTCDNQSCRNNVSIAEERLLRLQRDLSQMKDERTRLTVALDFAKEEKNHLLQQFKDLEDKNEQIRNQLSHLQLEKSSTEESLSRLQYLKTSDEAQLTKIASNLEQTERDRLVLEQDKIELEEEVTVLKRELVKAEELRMRLESFSGSLEHSLHATSTENEELKEQIDQVVQVNEQLTEKLAILERRCKEMDDSKIQLVEEISKLSKELHLFKERDEVFAEEIRKSKVRIGSLEEENRLLHEQLVSSRNAQQLAQVSMMATQTDYDGLQTELQRVTKEMQELLQEKEQLLIELDGLQQSTSAALAQLQNENKQQLRAIASMEEKLKYAAQEKQDMIENNTRDKQELEEKFQQHLKQLEQNKRTELEAVRLRHEQEVKTLQGNSSSQLSKFQEELAKKEIEKEQSLALAQSERHNLQEKLQSCISDLESERAELARLRREEVERQLEHRLAAEGFRSEILRLQNELRIAGEARVKDQQTSEQLLNATGDNLKKTEHDLSSTKAELVATNRELKDLLRQFEGIQIQLSKTEAQRDESRKETLLIRQQLDDIRGERDGLRDTSTGFESSVKRLESEKGELAKCLEEARKRIKVLEDVRCTLEQENNDLRSTLKEAEQQVNRLSEFLTNHEQQLQRSKDQQQRWKERCEALVEQLQAEQNRAILAEKTAGEHLNKYQALKLHCHQMEQQFSAKLQQSGAQSSIHQQRLDEMDLTLQRTLSRSKRFEEERHSFHSRLIDANKEVNILKQRLHEAGLQSQDLTDQLHRLDNEKRELSTRLSSLLSTLQRFIRILEEGQQKPQDFTGTSRYLRHLAVPSDNETAILRDTVDTDAIQNILQDLMRHILQLQSRRTMEIPVQDEPTKLSSLPRSRLSRGERQKQLVRQLQDADNNAAGLREQLNASLNTVASHASLGVQTLHRESTRLDGLVSGIWANSNVLSPSREQFENTPVKDGL